LGRSRQISTENHEKEEPKKFHRGFQGDRRRSDRVFDEAVVDLDLSVRDVATQHRPLLEDVAGLFAHETFARVTTTLLVNVKPRAF
jgi:hypothetical protein